MKKYTFIVLSVILFIFFFACTHKPEIPTPLPTKDTTTTPVITNTTTPVDTTTDVVDSTVCFQRDVLPVFSGSCAISGCHDAVTQAKGYNLTSYATIVLKGLTPGHSISSKLYTECVSGDMPVSPIPKLDSTQISYIKRWIDMGAPNDTNCAVNCDTTKYTYMAAIVPILSNYCYSCHSAAPAAGSGGGIILDNYNSLLAEAQSGKLLNDLQHTTGSNYMPLGGTQLSACKITQIRKWITAGAQNN